jgi:hypothetical protein
VFGSHYGPIIKENSMYPSEGKQSILFPNPNAKTLTVELVSKSLDPNNYNPSKPVFQYEHLGDYTLSVIPTGELHSVELYLNATENGLTATLTHKQTGIKVTYQNPDLLNNDTIQLVDGADIPPWDKDTLDGMRAKYSLEQSAWTKKELEDCVQMAMRVQELAKGYHNEKLQKGINALHASVSAVSYADPNEAARLANSIREFLDLLRQPEIGVIKGEEFRRLLDELTRITS